MLRYEVSPMKPSHRYSLFPRPGAQPHRSPCPRLTRPRTVAHLGAADDLGPTFSRARINKAVNGGIEPWT